MKNTLVKTKRFINVVLGRDLYHRLDLTCQCEKLGSEHAGWTIAKNKMRENPVIYSFGVGEDISFDLELIKKYGSNVHGFDPTPKSIRWVRSQRLPKNFIFHEFGIAGFDGDLIFYPPDNPKHVSFSEIQKAHASNPVKAPVKKLSTIMKELGHFNINVLKMDIEGSEYQVIDDMETTGIKPDQILVEFHHRFPGVGIQKTREAVKKLRKMGYGLFAVSPNGEEYSFVLLS